jgi:hypothetical protein
MINYVFGLGGRNFGKNDALNLLKEFENLDDEYLDEHNKLRYFGVRG